VENDVLRELYEKYYREALLYTLSLSGDRPLAEDIVADAFLKAYLSLPDGGESFRFWLLRVCRNLYIDHLRRQKVRSAREKPRSDAQTPSPEEELLADERRLALYRCMKKLPTADREIVSLFYFSGVPIGKIAELLGTTPGAVKTRLSRLRARLRKLMEDEYGV